MCDSCQRGTYAAATKSELCTPCESGRFQSVSGQTTCAACPGGQYTSAESQSFCQTCPLGGNAAPSCSEAEVAPTQQVLALDLANIVEPSSLSTRVEALTQLDTVQNQLTTCASTFTAEKAFATATAAAKATGAVASCAGSVAIDTNGNGKVESADAVELFVASTMQDFGAAQVLESFRATFPTGAVTAVKTILANVKAAMAAAARADKSAATTL